MARPTKVKSKHKRNQGKWGGLPPCYGRALPPKGWRPSIWATGATLTRDDILRRSASRDQEL
jgi:hypothetical protein